MSKMSCCCVVCARSWFWADRGRTYTNMEELRVCGHISIISDLWIQYLNQEEYYSTMQPDKAG